MAQELPDQIHELLSNPPSDRRSPPHDTAEPSLSRSSSGGSRLNAGAPEFVPRGPPGRGDHHHHARHHRHHGPPPPPRMLPIHHHGPPPPPPPMIHVFQPHPGAFHGPPVVPGHGSFEYYGGGGIAEQDAGHVQAEAEGAGQDHAAGDGLPEDVVHKVTKQVEYYFSDLNLATTEHLMRFISKDPEGFVPISVLAPFKKIRALVSHNAQLAAALRMSTKLFVSEDGKKVRRQLPITEADLEELQSRIVVAENLPEDHCYQNLLKVFSVVGGVKTIRTCYPQIANGTAPVNARQGKLDALLFNKLHAFVEYETVDQAEKAVVELNDEGNWRNGLRVRLLPSCMKQGQNRGKKYGNDGDTHVEDDESPAPNLPNDKHFEDHIQLNDASTGPMVEEGHHDRDGALKRGRGRGRGGRGRGRGQYHNNNRNDRNDGHPIGTPPGGHHIQIEQSAVANKHPPGPRMPDGTRGFTMGRGKPLSTSATVS